MSKARGAAFAAVVLIGACSGNATSPVASSSAIVPSVAPSTSVAPSASASANTATPPAVSAGPTTFISATYGYTLTVPAGWTSVQASKVWDGSSGLSSDSSDVDQFMSAGGAAATGVAAPFTKTLPRYVEALIAWTGKYHGNTCPPKPESQTPITVGGEPGVLVAWDCGILINNGVSIHNGIGYQFLFRDPNIHAATYPADDVTFRALLESVKYPT